jgi:hypothetical protein
LELVGPVEKLLLELGLVMSEPLGLSVQLALHATLWFCDLIRFDAHRVYLVGPHP